MLTRKTKRHTAGSKDEAVWLQRRKIRQGERCHVAALVAREALGAGGLRQLRVPASSL